MLETTPEQMQEIHRLVRDQCCNCVDGNCLLLDDGDTHPCVQILSCYGIYCNYFLRAVLPAEEILYAQIIEQNKRKKQEDNTR